MTCRLKQNFVGGNPFIPWVADANALKSLKSVGFTIVQCSKALVSLSVCLLIQYIISKGIPFTNPFHVFSLCAISNITAPQHSTYQIMFKSNTNLLSAGGHKKKGNSRSAEALKCRRQHLPSHRRSITRTPLRRLIRNRSRLALPSDQMVHSVVKQRHARNQSWMARHQNLLALINHMLFWRLDRDVAFKRADSRLISRRQHARPSVLSSKAFVFSE